MKKILLLASLAFTSIMQAQYPFFEGFESTAAGSLPSGWTSTGASVMIGHGNNSNNAMVSHMSNTNLMDTITTPSIGPLTSSSYFSIDYRIVNSSGYPATGTTLGSGDGVSFYAVTSLGTLPVCSISSTTNTCINPTGPYSPSATYITVTSTVVSQAPGFSGKIMAVIQRGSSGDYYVDFDNFIVKNQGSNFGIAKNSANSTWLSVAPNPSKGNFNVTLQNYTNGANVTVKLYSQLGQLVKTIQQPNIMNNEFNINASDIGRGLYLMEVSSGQDVSKTRVIIE